MFRTIAVICAALLLVACESLGSFEIGRSDSPTWFPEYRIKIGKCNDPKVCIGGFVKQKSGARILLIVDSCKNDCGDSRIGLAQLRTCATSYQCLDRIEYIVLPYDDQSQWTSASILYAQQIGEHK